MSSKKDFAQGEQGVRARKQPMIGAGEVGREVGGGWNPIVDWSETFPGNRGVNRDGEYDLYDAPVGVRLEIEEANKSDPVLRPDRAWEGEKGQLVPMALWQEGGKHHLLYTVWDRRNQAVRGIGEVRTCTCYAVSEDGYQWHKPELNLVEYEGSKANNMIDHTLTGTPLRDETAPAEERFRAVGQEGQSIDPDTGEILDAAEASRRFTAMEYGGKDYDGPRVESRHWLAVWSSEDGIHWTKSEKHAAERPSDGGNAAQYDAEKQEFYAYMRVAGMGRRAIGLTRTKDFTCWPDPELVFFPDPQDDGDVSFYGGNYFRYPGQEDLHGMMVQIYHQRTDHMDNQLAFSRNGVHWYRPEYRPIIPVGGKGSGEEGMVRVCLAGMTVLPDGYWGTMYEGCSMLHNATGVIDQPGTQVSWARWRPHRLCGIVADHEGRFTIPTIQRVGKELRLNYCCKLGGWIQVELIPSIPSRLHPDALAIPGYSFAESDRLTGDALDAPVTWNGKADVSAAGDEFAVRIRMFQAKLFAYRV